MIYYIGIPVLETLPPVLLPMPILALPVAIHNVEAQIFARSAEAAHLLRQIFTALMATSFRYSARCKTLIRESNGTNR
jgi:hypothetical protein